MLLLALISLLYPSNLQHFYAIGLTYLCVPTVLSLEDAELSLVLPDQPGHLLLLPQVRLRAGGGKK